MVSFIKHRYCHKNHHNNVSAALECSIVTKRNISTVLTDEQCLTTKWLLQKRTAAEIFLHNEAIEIFCFGTRCDLWKNEELVEQTSSSLSFLVQNNTTS